MMSLKNLGLTLGPLVRTLFALSLYVLKSLLLVYRGLKYLHQYDLNLLLVFLCLTFSHQQESIPNMVDSS